MDKLKTGILGCGAIAPAYLKNLTGALSPFVEVVACADMRTEAAQSRATEFSVARVCSPEEMLAAPDIELVVNLTPAPAHHAVNLSILRAGKHLFSEKPLALSRPEGREILDLAEKNGLRVAGAADTFLGASLQLSRKLIDDGRIGVPLAAQALVALPMYNSAVYHHVFRGPLLDMGPYYLTALVALLGPIARVSGAAEIRFPEKPYPANSPDAGKTFKVDIPTTSAATLTFAEGPVATVVSTCDVHGYFPRVEIYGTAGTLILNDANYYGGEVTLNLPGGPEKFESAPGFSAEGRGLGIAEMALALRTSEAPRSNGNLMYHVLDAMLAVHDSSAASRHVDLESTVTRPAPFDFEQARGSAE